MDFKKIQELLDSGATIDGIVPVGKTKDTFLDLSAKQKQELRANTFKPNCHLLALSGPNGLECIEVPITDEIQFQRKLKELEEECFVIPYTYLGVTTIDGKIIIE